MKLLLLWEIIMVMINLQLDIVSSNSVIKLVINISDALFAVVRFCSSLVWLQTELDYTQSYYHYFLFWTISKESV